MTAWRNCTGTSSSGSLTVCRLVAFSFFFSSRRRHTRFDCDWSSDVCSSDLYAPRSRRRRTENDRWGGIEVFAAVVLADAKDVQPDLIGMFDLLDQVAQTIRHADRNAGVVVRRREAIDADLHLTPQPSLLFRVGQAFRLGILRSPLSMRPVFVVRT